MYGGDYGAALGFHVSDLAKVQCKGTTGSGSRCRRWFWIARPIDPLTCKQHRDQEPKR